MRAHFVNRPRPRSRMRALFVSRPRPRSRARACARWLGTLPRPSRWGRAEGLFCVACLVLGLF